MAARKRNLVEHLTAHCRAMDSVTEDVKWEHHLVFSIGGKMFALFEESLEMPFSFKASPEAFEQLSAQDGMRPAPYLQRAQWIQVQDDEALPLGLLEELLDEARLLVGAKLTKKLQRELGLLE